MQRAIKLLDGVTTVSTGAGFFFAQPVPSPLRRVQAFIKGTGTVSASIAVEGSIDNGENWATEYTISLSGTNTDTWIGTQMENQGMHRGRIISISGTAAAVTLQMES